MLKYNLCFLRQNGRILLLNRERSHWMGRWNGIGGKLEQDEQPRASALREIEEETELALAEAAFKGIVTWSDQEGGSFGGMYLYVAEVAGETDYPAPRKTDEGILDWKEIDWIMHPDNAGVASNISYFLGNALGEKQCYHYHNVFRGNDIFSSEVVPLNPAFETDEAFRSGYLSAYRASRSFPSTTPR